MSPRQPSDLLSPSLTGWFSGSGPPHLVLERCARRWRGCAPCCPALPPALLLIPASFLPVPSLRSALPNWSGDCCELPASFPALGVGRLTPAGCWTVPSSIYNSPTEPMELFALQRSMMLTSALRIRVPHCGLVVKRNNSRSLLQDNAGMRAGGLCCLPQIRHMQRAQSCPIKQNSALRCNT